MKTEVRHRVFLVQRMSGLKWEESGVKVTEQGIELHDAKLASALLWKQEFSREEIDQFEGVSKLGVPYNCFINASGKYFKPAADWWERE